MFTNLWFYFNKNVIFHLKRLTFMNKHNLYLFSLSVLSLTGCNANISESISSSSEEARVEPSSTIDKSTSKS